MRKTSRHRFDSNERYREAMERGNWKKAIDLALETEFYESAVESICEQLYVYTRDAASREKRVDKLHEAFSYLVYGLTKVYEKKGGGEFLPYEQLPRGICDYTFSLFQHFGTFDFRGEFLLVLRGLGGKEPAHKVKKSALLKAT